MPERSDLDVAKRWRDRVRFVLDDRGDIVPEWRYPELIPSRVRESFETRVRAEGPSLVLVADLERSVLEAARDLVRPGTDLETILDQKGFTSWPLAKRGTPGV